MKLLREVVAVKKEQMRAERNIERVIAKRQTGQLGRYVAGRATRAAVLLTRLFS